MKTSAIERLKDNPKTTWLGLLLGAAAAAAAAGVIPQPYGAIVTGAAPLVASVALVLAKD